MFAVELDKTGWRVIDGCLDFGPYDSRLEAEDVARALNELGWKRDGLDARGKGAGPEVEVSLPGRSIN